MSPALACYMAAALFAVGAVSWIVGNVLLAGIEKDLKAGVVVVLAGR